MRTVTLEVNDDEPVFVIRGKDVLAVGTVQAYLNSCITSGLYAQATEVDKALDEIALWQDAHPELVQDPYHKHVPVPTPPTPRTKEEKIAFRKQWDERVEEGLRREFGGE